MASPTDDLRARLAVLADLRAAGALLGWDRETMMPARGADARGDVQATLDTLAHELLAGPELAALLDAAAGGRRPRARTRRSSASCGATTTARRASPSS